ncbi:MAG: ankyrin repeat domain-containing protein [Pseudomonadota bacterium]
MSKGNAGGECIKDNIVSAFVMRKLGLTGAIASAVLVSAVFISLVAGGAVMPAHAQLYSKGYEFLEAVEERDGDVVTEMLNEPGTQVINTRSITTGETGLHIVAKRRDSVWVKFLLQRGANPNVKDKNGIYPIQISTQLGDLDSVEALIKKGAIIDIADQQGETPLISAVHKRDNDLIRRLLKQGADPDRNDNSGRSARDYAQLMAGNDQLLAIFEAADEERKEKGTTKQYGPSF